MRRNDGHSKKVEYSMDRRASSKVAEHNRALEAAYRRGYHHGLTQTADLIFGLLSSGMPASAVADLCRVFEEQVVIPWRSLEAKGNSAPPRFDLEECQRSLREHKERQST
jgi:hypothetical protein